MSEYTDSGCIEFVGAAFKRCLSRSGSKEDVETRINFVENSPVFKLFCEVTEQDPVRLKNLVLVRNHKILKEL